MLVGRIGGNPSANLAQSCHYPKGSGSIQANMWLKSEIRAKNFDTRNSHAKAEAGIAISLTS